MWRLCRTAKSLSNQPNVSKLGRPPTRRYIPPRAASSFRQLFSAPKISPAAATLAACVPWGTNMDEILDRLFAEMVSNRILCMRMWGYLASVSGDETQFVEHQRKMSLASVELWSIEGHRDPERVRTMARAAINAAWDGVIRIPSPQSP